MTSSTITVLKEGNGAFNSTFKLEHRTAGLMVAGSGTREVLEHWAVIRLSPFDGHRSGQAFKTEQEAQEYFERYTTPIIEQRA